MVSAGKTKLLHAARMTLQLLNINLGVFFVYFELNLLEPKLTVSRINRLKRVSVKDIDYGDRNI